MKLLIHAAGTYRAKEPFGPAVWRHHDFLTVREGELEFHTADGQLILQAGDAIWIPPGVKFWGRGTASRNTMWVIHFRDPELRAGQFTDQIKAGVGVFREGVHSPLAFELMKRLEKMHIGENRWEQGAVTFFQALLHEAKANRARTKRPSTTWREDLEDWARSQLASRLKIDDLARRAGFSPSYFRQLFKREQGHSAGRFLQNLRLREAEILLRQSSLRLKEISNRVGYSDAAAFHRAFVQRYQLTPSNYRKSASRTI